MKRASVIIPIILIPMLLVTLTSFQARDPQSGREAEKSTKLETFLAKKGILIIKELYGLGEVGGAYDSKVKIDAIVAYVPGKEDLKIKGLRIEVTDSRRSQTSLIDIDEAESLSKALQYMIDLAKRWKKTGRRYTEVIFSTKGGFKIGFYQSGDKQTGFVSSGYIAETYCFFKDIDMMENPIVKLKFIKDMVDGGLKLLSGK